MGWTFLLHFLEYRPATSRWGVMLQAGYDSRKGSFDQCLLHVIVRLKNRFELYHH
jgi:hypothetical protein